MDQIALERREKQASEWAERIKECQSSGMPVQHWCKENGINTKTYYNHLRRLREKVPEQIPVPLGKLPAQCTQVITIRSEELCVEIADSVSPETIETVIRALKC